MEICYDNARSYAGLGFSMTGNGYLDTDDGRLYIAFMKCKGFTLELIQLVGVAADSLQ